MNQTESQGNPPSLTEEETLIIRLIYKGDHYRKALGTTYLVTKASEQIFGDSSYVGKVRELLHSLADKGVLKRSEDSRKFYRNDEGKKIYDQLVKKDEGS